MVVADGHAAPERDDSLDHLGQRRLTVRETWFWYLLAGATYVAASIWQKFLLNWLIGPIWLVAVVWLGPAIVDRVRRRR